MSDDGHAVMLRSVGEKIRVARQAARMTQDQVAKRIGMTRSSVANLEAGRQDMNLSRLAGLARVLSLDLNEVIALVELPPEPPVPHAVVITPVLEVSCTTCGGLVLDVTSSREAARESRKIHIAATAAADSAQVAP
jgi:transcriptional regulator with XRE-family HTH domain